jgi:hypothetical protein
MIDGMARSDLSFARTRERVDCARLLLANERINPNGEEAIGKRLSRYRCGRRQREILVGCRPRRRRDSGQFATRSPCRRGHQDGHEGGRRESHGFPDPRGALIQIRGLIELFEPTPQSRS